MTGTTSRDELTEEEAAELMTLLCKIRQVQREVLQIEHVYYFYNEDTTHHFHVWMVPRYEWMYEFGRSIESVRPILLHAREMNSEENLKTVRQAIQLL
jgi:diadenosine tetraphosphate (Ap4A) HIT family hydrolase